MIGRRSLLVAAGAFACVRPVRAAPLPVPPNGRLGFNVLCDGNVLGTHILTFEGEGDSPTVRVAVDLSFGLGPVKLYRYTHRATEIWRNGKVFSLVAETDDDGKKYKVNAVRTDEGLVVEGPKASRYVAPEDALPATHWNRKMLDGPIINTQYGDLMRPSIAPLGQEEIPAVGGKEIRASHFALTGDAVLDTWYDSTPSWAGISFKAKGDRSIRYERL